jgi:hypothetical protein
MARQSQERVSCCYSSGSGAEANERPNCIRLHPAASGAATPARHACEPDGRRSSPIRPPTVAAHLISKAAHGRSNRRSGLEDPGCWRNRPLRIESDGSAAPSALDTLTLTTNGAAFSLPFPRRPSAAQQRETDAGKPNGTVSSAPRPERENRPAATKNAGRGGGRIHTHVTIPRSSFPFRRARHFCPTGARRTCDFCATGAGACPLARGGSSTTDAAPTNTVPKPPILVHVVFTHPPYPLCVVFTNERRNGTANRPDLAFERRQHTAERSSWVGNTNDPP